MKKGKSGCYFLTLGKTRGTYFSKMYSKYYFIASFFFFIYLFWGTELVEILQKLL